MALSEQVAGDSLPAPRALAADDGVQLAWYSWGAPTGIPVVLQHGFSADARTNWVGPGVVTALLNAGRWVVALDARGHGQSDKPHDSRAYGHTRMGKDVQALISNLAEAYGISQFDYAGYSMGGFIGVQVMSLEDRLRRAVISAVGVAAAGAGTETPNGLTKSPVNRDAIADAMERYAADPQINIRESFTDPDAIAFLRYARFTGGDLLALAAQMKAPMERPSGFESSSAQVLVLAGVDDHLATTAENLAERLPNARCVRVPGDHLTAVAQPEFIAELVTFLG
jgi:pimeloyl-ACP methyl ester carboxylesterase